jgi:hypothetical protein
MPPELAPELAEESSPSELSSEDILAELATMREEEANPTEEVEEEPAEDAEESEDDSDDEDDDLDDEDDEDEDLDDEDEDEEEPENLKGLAKIKSAEKSFSKRMKAEKAELQDEKDKWTERVQSAEKVAATQANYKSLANSNPVALFEDLGVEGSDAFQALGKYFFQYGKGISPDATPQDKQAAESVKRLREQTAGLQKNSEEIAELNRKLKSNEKAESDRKQISAYQEKIGRIATKKFPLAARMLSSKAKEEVQEDMLNIAREINRKTGQAPSAQKVLKRYEAAERRKLEARGIDVDALTTATPKKNPDKAAKKKTVSPKPTNQDDDELSPEDQILRELQEARANGEIS